MQCICDKPNDDKYLKRMLMKVSKNEQKVNEVREEIKNMISKQKAHIQREPKIRTKNPTSDYYKVDKRHLWDMTYLDDFNFVPMQSPAWSNVKTPRMAKFVDKIVIEEDPLQ